jgi:hypothetical protein
MAAQAPVLSVHFPSMVELTPQQMQMMERLFEAGFRPVAIPPYENALCLKRGDCAAVLAPVPNGGLKMLAPPSYMVVGNLSVKLKRGPGEVFVWKKNEVEATPDRLEELSRFKRELMQILDFAPQR